ncbi:MAG: histidine--tRNA ligase [Chlamydiia bacterium]|nr:histidine--tRNA ligase [Chlamydiia bacterium]
MEYRIAKGVFDILPHDPDTKGRWRSSAYWHYVEKQIHEIAREFGFSEIRTPLFESTELFTRSIGATSDIVTKEMYTFFDKANRSLTLRPEGTAPVMRSLIEKKLCTQQKVYYLYSMFRYERQQAGRYRQHHQFGIEAVGNASPYQDAEGIILLYTLLTRLGLKNLTLHLNSIGDSIDRNAYRTALQNFLKPYFKCLSVESQARFETNPLRILDSKDSRDIEITQNAPFILEFLRDETKSHFETVCALLKNEGVYFNVNPKLVRGLDYYNRTVFEITSEHLGAQNALGGGGRYDGLIKDLGGPDTPAFGFGAGLERIIQAMLAQGAYLPEEGILQLYMIPLGEKAFAPSFHLLNQLRNQHIVAQMDFSEKKLKSAMKFANQIKAQYVVVIGEEELKTGKISLKNMKTGENKEVSIDQLVETMKHV